MNGEKRALVVGAAGFVGGYLLEHLRGLGWRVSATKLPGERLNAPGPDGLYDLDICDGAATKALFEKTVADNIYVLAAQSSVKRSWSDPQTTVQINVLGTLNILEALRATDSPARVLLVGSGEEYGFITPQELPIRETVLPRPGNIYAVTKNTQNQLAAVYARAFGLDILSTRSFAHLGPGQLPGFVLPDFCSQVAEIEAGRREPVLYVGNLEAKRDYCDVRDVVAAYALLAGQGAKGETYNVGSGKSVSIQWILDTLLSFSKVPVSVKQDAARMRPSDVPEIRADISKLRRTIGWEPKIPLEQSILDTLEYHRALLA